jgi:hypothetical protein
MKLRAYHKALPGKVYAAWVRSYAVHYWKYVKVRTVGISHGCCFVVVYFTQTDIL